MLVTTVVLQGAFQRGTLNGTRVNISGLTSRPGQRQNDDWTLEGLGNWLSNPSTDQGVAAVTETRNHTDFNKINQRTISGNNTTQTLDKNGSITDTGNTTAGGQIFKGGGLRIEYDALNRIRAIHYNNNTPGSTGDDTQIAEITYDCSNRRMRMKITNTNSTLLDGTTDYYYGGWRVIEEHDPDNSDRLERQYVYGIYLDEVWTLDDRHDGTNPISVDDLNEKVISSDNDRRFYHGNTLYSIYAMTDESKNIDEAYQYNAYGLPTVWKGNGGDAWFNNNDVLGTTITIGANAGTGSPVSNIENFRLYTGQYWIPLDVVDTTDPVNPESELGTGLHYYKNRYQSPDLGRFISRDPIGYSSGDFGLYEYVSSRSTWALDPFGFEILRQCLWKCWHQHPTKRKFTFPEGIHDDDCEKITNRLNQIQLEMKARCYRRCLDRVPHGKTGCCRLFMHEENPDNAWTDSHSDFGGILEKNIELIDKKLGLTVGKAIIEIADIGLKGVPTGPASTKGVRDIIESINKLEEVALRKAFDKIKNQVKDFAPEPDDVLGATLNDGPEGGVKRMTSDKTGLIKYMGD